MIQQSDAVQKETKKSNNGQPTVSENGVKKKSDRIIK